MTILGTGSSRRNERGGGFTLVEVLIAFAVLITAVTLIATQWSRSLSALQFLESSITLQRLAEEQMIQEILRRELNLRFPSEKSWVGPAAEWSLQPFSWSEGPLKGLVIDQSTVKISSKVRDRTQSVEITGGFQQNAQGQ
ncbi:MAG: type II secretion system protein [Candidatus Omnitrophica bacterium]|nr:type II secretion system protein [Candidatus Omnitrophota bacterium]